MRKLGALLMTLMILPAADVFAAAGGSGDHGAHGAEKAAGLPQLDPTYFVSQIFWLCIAFGILYFFFSKKTLPEISSVIESRNEHIQSDLDSASDLKKEAEEVYAAYEAILNDARKKSTKSFAQAEEKIKARAAEVYGEFQERSATEIAAREASIEKAKAAAMEEMNTMAAEIAQEAAAKIIGVKTDLKQAKTVVESLHGAKAKAA